MTLLLEIWIIIVFSGLLFVLWKSQYKWNLIDEKYHALYNLQKLDEELTKKGSSFAKLDEFATRFESKKWSRLDRIDKYYKDEPSKKEGK